MHQFDAGMRRVAWATIVAAVGVVARDARAESLSVQVNRAIDRGVAFARKYVSASGAGKTGHHDRYPDGDTALLVYTLLKSGVPAEDPQVAKALEWLRYRPFEKTYSTAMVILALDALKDPSKDEWIQRGANWLDEKFHPTSLRWNYPGNHTDLSNTQFAALGLWVAERHGFTARPEVWSGLLSGVMELQEDHGGFRYRTDHEASGAMTVAGLTVLELALARVPESDRASAAARKRARAGVEKGWAYLDQRFVPHANPTGLHAFESRWHLYFLYGVERLAALTSRDTIGGRDWYREGARHLVATQEKNGSWGGPADTCFALLFLRRATATAMERSTKPLEGEGVDDKPLPAKTKPRADVPFIRRWLLLGPIADPDDALLGESFFSEEKAAPTPYSHSGPHAWVPARSIASRVDLGGTAAAPKLTCAFTWLHAARDLDVVLWIGHDDGARVFLDGALVHDRHFHEDTGEDAFGLPVRLTAGAHRLLFKVDDRGSRHALWCRIAAPDGSPVAGLLPSLSPTDSELAATALAQPGLFDVVDLLPLLQRDNRTKVTFDVPDHLDRLAFEGSYRIFPTWRGEPGEPRDLAPNPGAFGLLGLHPIGKTLPGTAYWKVRVPEGRARLRIRVSASSSASKKADGVLRVGVQTTDLQWVLSEVIGPDASPAEGNWRWLEADMEPWAGREVLLVFEAVNGGRTNWQHEGIWIDEIEVRNTP